MRISRFRMPVALALTALFIGLAAADAPAKEFQYTNVTELTGGPGQGNAPSISDNGEIAFYTGTDVYVVDRTGWTFTELTALPGAPVDAWFPKLNNQGNVAMINPYTRDLWLYKAATQSFTNISTLPGYPGNSQAHSLRTAFDLNDHNRMCFHSGDLNFGDVYLYDDSTGVFQTVSDVPDGATRGRDCAINNADQVGYAGLADIYIYDIAADTTQNITDLPGGPGSAFGAFALNDLGDVAVFTSGEITLYDASAGTFLYLSTLPDWPAGTASSNANDLSDNLELTFWRTNQYYFDAADSTFTQLNNQGSVPVGGMESSINDAGEIAFTAGLAFAEDIFLAVGPVSAVRGPGPNPRFALRQNAPNPFRAGTVIEYEVAGEAHYALEVFDVRGRVVRRLVDAVQSPGRQSRTWDGRDEHGERVPMGTYFYRLRSGPWTETRKLMLVR